jgi:hypothetical protein
MARMMTDSGWTRTNGNRARRIKPRTSIGSSPRVVSRDISTKARPLSDTQRQYISMAHKPTMTSATPIRPAKSKYKKKPL